MIFSEWTDLQEHKPAYNQPVILMVENKDMEQMDACQMALPGQRVLTDAHGECFQVGNMHIYDNYMFSKSLDDPSANVNLFVTHWMEMPPQQLFPLSTWRKKEIRSLAESAVQGMAELYAKVQAGKASIAEVKEALMHNEKVKAKKMMHGGSPFASGNTKVFVKNPLDDAKIIKK